jgi:hypothetical protein
MIKDLVYTIGQVAPSLSAYHFRFVTPSNQLPYPPSSSNRTSLITSIPINKPKNASKHRPLRTPGWASSSRTHPPSKQKHPHNQPHINRGLNLNPLRLRPSRQDHNPPLLAVRHSFQRQRSHHYRTRPQPDQRPTCRTSSQTKQCDRCL